MKEIDYEKIYDSHTLSHGELSFAEIAIAAMKAAVKEAVPVILDGCCKWVKCSERLPNKNGNYYMKDVSKKFTYYIQIAAYDLEKFGHYEWLDESPENLAPKLINKLTDHEKRNSV